MFEDTNQWGAWEEIYHEEYGRGRMLGYALGQLEVVIDLIRNLDKTKDESRSALESYLEKKYEAVQYEELCTLIQKYPYMSTEKLAERILKESEFCYF